MSKSVRHLLVATAVGGTLALVVVVAATLGGDRQHSGSATPVTHAPAPDSRTVLVSDARMPGPSRAATQLHALRVSGPMPSRPAPATVLTDEDCAPDGRGISRCLNRVRLRSGETLSLRHPHRMMDVPCLSPGEQVTVRPA